MPDQFQEYSYLASPSSSGSSCSPAPSSDAGGGISVGFTEWTRDYQLDALYGTDPDTLPELTDEDLELLASIPLEGLPLPDSQGQAIAPFLLQGFPYAQNVHAQNMVPTPPAMTAQPHPSNLPRTPLPAQPSQLFSPSQPRQHTQLPPLAPVAPALPPTPPHSGHPHPLPPTSATSINPHVRAPWPPVPPTGERERLALPAPGDLNYSACEVIM